MSERGTPDREESAEPIGEGAEQAPSAAYRLAAFQRAGSFSIPLVTTLFAFVIGGFVIALTNLHNDPLGSTLRSYKGIFTGTGLTWLFPWVTGDARTTAGFDLQQTLLLTTTLILTGLAVAFAFKCGLFNIGGQGQYVVGASISVWVGSSFLDMPPLAHVIVCVVLAALGGAMWAAIAGFLKATVGAHEVITTIMLNWIAVWVAQFLFGRDGPLQNDVDKSIPISNDIARDARLPVFWGDADLQGLHVGFFIALAMPVVFWLILSRTTLGYEVRAVGFSPEAARYGGINVRKSYVLAMAISGVFAGLAGAVDILGWQFRLGVLDVQVSNLGYLGIAVALLGRNSAIGIPLAALLFGGLVQGTSTRNPAIQDVFDPQLAGNLTIIIQGLILLFVGADLIVIYAWRKLRRRRPRAVLPVPAGGRS